MYYSNEHSPIHVHVTKGGARAIENNGLKPSELKLVESIIEENVEVIAEHWNNYFNKSENGRD